MNNGLQFLSVTWTDSIPDNEIIMILRDVHTALRQALRFMPDPDPVSLIRLPEVRPFGYWILQDADPDAIYGSAKWYMDQSYDISEHRLTVQRYLNLVMNEPYQHHIPHYDLAVVHYPLYDREAGKEVVGAEIAGRAAITSTAPLNRLAVRDERGPVLKRLISHYLGRVIGIPFIEQGKPGGCSGACAMRPAGDIREWLRLAQEEAQANVIYCESCRWQLSAQIASNQLGRN
jgi:predicted Zn-dependent protease